jgi:hypothetical protein
MIAFAVLYGLYAVPAVVLFGATLAVLRSRETPRLLGAEYWVWLLPGLVYWALSQPLGLEQAFGGKSLSNLIEPMVLAGTAWMLFLVRLVVAASRPSLNRVAAYLFIGLCNLAALGVLALMPSLPE